MTDVYFIGIGGIGMSAIARYFKFKGLRVSGYAIVENYYRGSSSLQLRVRDIREREDII